MATAAAIPILAGTSFDKVQAKLAEKLGKELSLDPGESLALSSWPNQHPPENWFAGKFDLEGDATGSLLFGIELPALYAMGSLLGDVAEDTIQEKIGAIKLEDADRERFTELANVIAEAAGEAIKEASGKEITVKLAGFDEAAKVDPVPDLVRGFQANCKIVGGTFQGKVAFVFPKSLEEFVGGEDAGGADASEEPEFDGKFGDLDLGEWFPSASAGRWWVKKLPKPKSVIALGSGLAIERAAVVCKILELPFKKAKDPAEFDQLLASEEGAAVLAFFENAEDPWFGKIADARRTEKGREMRLLIGLPKGGKQWRNAAYVLPPTAVWNHPHDLSELAGMLTTPMACA